MRSTLYDVCVFNGKAQHSVQAREGRVGDLIGQEEVCVRVCKDSWRWRGSKGV